MKKILFIIALAGLAAAGCTKEQSSITVDNATEEAVVSGTVKYNPGYFEEAGGYVSYAPSDVAGGAKVVVFVSNSSFNPNNSGYRTYETVTDSKGKFSVKVPCVSGRSINVNVKAQLFTTYYDEEYSNTLYKYVVKPYANAEFRGSTTASLDAMFGTSVTLTMDVYSY